MAIELTIGLIAGELRARAARSLSEALRQTALGKVEILVVDLVPEAGPLAGAEHECVRYLPRPNLHYYCEAQAELAREARAPLIAFLEDHSFASPGWAKAVLAAFGDPRVAVVNYAFTTVRGGYRSRSILMAEYGYWMAPHPGGPISHSASANVAYRRDLLLKHMGAGDASFETEFLMHRAILEKGGVIWLSPDALVAHESWGSVGDACRANGSQRRVLGARRAAGGHWSLPRRVAWAAGMAFLPPVLAARLAWALRKRPRLWMPFLAALPVITAINSCSAWNEALGYLFGAGASRDEFRDRELAVPRGA